MVRPEKVLGLAAAVASSAPSPAVFCPDYASYAFSSRHEPHTGGRYNLPFQRPKPACRRFHAPEVEATINAMRGLVRDPDLFRLFENCFPNTLDTAIAWRGLAEGTTDEELTFITTGDITAMWLRDSANQLQSYKSVLRANASRDSLASLFRGALNLQARYIQGSPHCNAFQAPKEADMTDSGYGTGGGMDYVSPPLAYGVVHECKYELDSLAAFLQLSYDYYAATGDVAFFGRSYPRVDVDVDSNSNSSSDRIRSDSVVDHPTDGRGGWVRAVEEILTTATEMQAGTYDADGRVRFAPYQFQRHTTTASETLANGGAGSPVKGGTGLVRSAFRPSDDACTYQLFVPANMQLARYLAACAPIVAQLGRMAADRVERVDYHAMYGPSSAAAAPPTVDGVPMHQHYATLAQRMADFAETIRLGIERHGRVDHPAYGNVYAYEVDGYGSHNLMDDANIPSLLSAALFGYVNRTDPVYQNTRRFVLSADNPYFMHGPVLNATGGPHVGPGMAWPMGLIVKIMTEDDDREILLGLQQLVSSTDGLGLMHEAINSHNEAIWTRQWFSWANGLFGQMMLDLRDRKPHLLATSFQ
ncbi:hypothetical protein SPI_00448 [Niveomyces insectorum RCEF 264]|uniref:DUF1237 domain containing protein n=1 Tax=Niveomyces insectorum RCEF 264 TaxID=1081102 RepID=A0A168A4X5_9HYPO|nr:hypothetical protein SPI_00448 [Niveomyces insectorum RCEF 264]